MTTLPSAPSLDRIPRRLPIASIVLCGIATVILAAILARWAFKPSPLSIPPGWTGADLWAEFELRLENGRPLRSGDTVASGTRATLVRSAPPPAAGSGGEPSTASATTAAQPNHTPSHGNPASIEAQPPTFDSTQTAREGPLQLLCFGNFDVDAWTVTVEPRERVLRMGSKSWNLGGLNEGSIVTFHAEGPHSLVLASHPDRRYSTRWLEFTVVPAPEPSNSTTP